MWMDKLCSIIGKFGVCLDMNFQRRPSRSHKLCTEPPPLFPNNVGVNILLKLFNLKLEHVIPSLSNIYCFGVRS
jgi:hypothetical protein